VKRDTLPLLWARGLVAALAPWKAILLALLLNAALAIVVTAPLASRLHDVLDARPAADGLAHASA